MNENFKINLSVGSGKFTITIRSGVLSRKDGFSKEAKLSLQFDTSRTMVSVLTGTMPAQEAVSNGALTIEGDISLIQKIQENVGKDNPNFPITTK